MRAGLAFAIVCAALVFGASDAQADSFKFSYEFDSGELLSGTADGTVNGNLVEFLSNIVITFDGTPATNAPFYGSSWDDAATNFQSGGAVLSFDGTENNFMFSNVDFPTVSIGLTEYWYDITPTLDGVQGIVAIDPESGLNVGFRAGSIGEYGTWTLMRVTSPIPEPGSLILLGLGLIGLGAASRRARKRRTRD